MSICYLFLHLFLPFKFLFLLHSAVFQCSTPPLCVNSSSCCNFIGFKYQNIQINNALTYTIHCGQPSYWLKQFCSCFSIQDCGFSAHYRPWWSIRCVCTSQCLSSCGSQQECGCKNSWPHISTSTSCSSSSWRFPTSWSSWPFLSLTGPRRTASPVIYPTGLASRSVPLLVSAGQNESSHLDNDFNAAPAFV